MDPRAILDYTTECIHYHLTIETQLEYLNIINMYCTIIIIVNDTIFKVRRCSSITREELLQAISPHFCVFGDKK